MACAGTHLLQCQEVELRGGAGNASRLGGLAQQWAARLPAHRAQLGSLRQRRQAHAYAQHQPLIAAPKAHYTKDTCLAKAPY